MPNSAYWDDEITRFLAHEWNSYSPKLLEHIPESDREKMVNLTDASECLICALGSRNVPREFQKNLKEMPRFCKVFQGAIGLLSMVSSPKSS